MSRAPVTCTRRRALHGAVALLGALAGCSSSTSDSGRSHAPGTAEHVETEPEHYALRRPNDAPPARIRSEAAPDRERASPTDDDDRRRARHSGLIASREGTERLAFADVDGVDATRAFVEATDFDRETLLLDTDRVGECFELELCYLTWSTTEYHTYYARLYRDVDVHCRADAHDGVAHLVRIPEALDPERVTGAGSGIASGTCDPWRRRLERRRTRTDAGTATDGTDAASGGR